MFFKVQVFQGPGFQGPGSRIQVQDPGPGFRSSLQKQLFTDVLQNRCSKKFRNIHRKKSFKRLLYVQFTSCACGFGVVIIKGTICRGSYESQWEFLEKCQHFRVSYICISKLFHYSCKEERIIICNNNRRNTVLPCLAIYVFLAFLY